MDGFELHVRQRSLEQRWHGFRLIVQKSLQRRQALRDVLGRRRYEHRIAWPGTPNPPLCTAQHARRLGLPTRVREQHLVHFAQQSSAHRQTAAKSF